MPSFEPLADRVYSKSAFQKLTNFPNNLLRWMKHGAFNKEWALKKENNNICVTFFQRHDLSQRGTGLWGQSRFWKSRKSGIRFCQIRFGPGTICLIFLIKVLVEENFVSYLFLVPLDQCFSTFFWFEAPFLGNWKNCRHP